MVHQDPAGTAWFFAIAADVLPAISIAILDWRERQKEFSDRLPLA
jgi:hypothetical protein